MGPAIARFSITHPITGSAAWVTALVTMALADVLTGQCHPMRFEVVEARYPKGWHPSQARDLPSRSSRIRVRENQPEPDLTGCALMPLRALSQWSRGESRSPPVRCRDPAQVIRRTVAPARMA